MCVAVLVETKEGPTAEELFQMEDSNPHGGGIAWAGGELIRFRKGLTWRQIRDVLPHLPRPVLLHFRWATHGGRARYLSHPFPLGSRALTSRKLNSASKAVLIHNGVWSDYLKFMPRGVDVEKWSDTAVAAYAAGVYGEEILDYVDWATAVGRAAGGGRMDVTLRGRWFEHNGNQYSNLSWQPGYYRSSVMAFEDFRDSLRGYGWPSSDGYGSSGYGGKTCQYDLRDLTSEPTGDLEQMVALTAQPTNSNVGWRDDGKLIDLTGLETPTPESEIQSWLSEEFAAVQRALGEENDK